MNNVKILVIDIDKNNNNLIKNILEEEKIDFEIITSANEAIKKIENENISMAMIDMNMAEISGFEFLLWLRKHKPKCQAILMSAMGEVEITAFYQMYGQFKYLQKPIDSKKFMVYLDEVKNIGFEGNLGKMTLFDFIQIVLFSRKDKLISVTDKISNEEGLIFVEKGKVVHSIYKEFSGEEAFYRIMSLDGGVFSDKPFVEPENKTINKDTNMLLLKATRMKDKYQEEVSQSGPELKKILVVDDQKMVRAIIEKYLNKKGFEAYSVESAVQAVANLQQEKFDLVITDINMPEINGLELFLWIKKNAPNTQVIIMTAHGSNEISEFSRSKGALSYLDKPVDLPVLNSIIEGYSSEGFSGNITEIDLFSFLQIIIMSNENKLIHVKSKNDDKEGFIYLKKGKVVHANYNKGTKGQDAFIKILSIENGTFNNYEWTEPEEESIQLPTEMLIFEAGRIIDETRQAEQQPQNMMMMDTAIITEIENKIDLVKNKEIKE